MKKRGKTKTKIRMAGPLNDTMKDAEWQCGKEFPDAGSAMICRQGVRMMYERTKMNTGLSGKKRKGKAGR